MHPRHHQRQEKYQQHLAVNGAFHLPAAHAHLLHDLKPRPILVALGDLLVIHDQHRGKQAHQSQDNAQKQQSPAHSRHGLPGAPHGVACDNQTFARLLLLGEGHLLQVLLHIPLQLFSHITVGSPARKARRDTPGVVRGRIPVDLLLLVI